MIGPQVTSCLRNMYFAGPQITTMSIIQFAFLFHMNEIIEIMAPLSLVLYISHSDHKDVRYLGSSHQDVYLTQIDVLMNSLLPRYLTSMYQCDKQRTRLIQMKILILRILFVQNQGNSIQLQFNCNAALSTMACTNAHLGQLRFF